MRVVLIIFVLKNSIITCYSSYISLKKIMLICVLGFSPISELLLNHPNELGCNNDTCWEFILYIKLQFQGLISSTSF